MSGPVKVMTPAEAEARQQQVNGAPERIAQLPRAQFPAEAQAICEQVFGALGIGVPDTLAPYFAILIKHPALFRQQMETGITFFRGVIPVKERELAVLRMAWRAGAPYEWSEHAAIAKTCGWTEADVERVIAGPDADGWSHHHRAIVRAVDELHGDTMISDATWAVLAESWDEAQLLEFPALVGQYLLVAMIQNSIRLPLGNDPRGLHAR
ncbi:MAG: carboxymuconolactone decarboxylase family protein [Sphingomonadales bacterium]|nr:carboxymuconolactone decarboxylase family protein [Sphingomonadales bacterium]